MMPEDNLYRTWKRFENEMQGQTRRQLVVLNIYIASLQALFP